MAAEADLLDTDEELGTGHTQRRDWKGIITALLVIFIICLLIFLCGYIFTPLNANAQDPSHHLLNLTDFKQFRASTGAPSWLRDGRLVFDSDQGLNIMTVDGNHSVLIAYKEIHDLLQRGASIQCNADCSHVSLSYAAENPSTNPELTSNVVNVLDLKTKTMVRVTRDAKQAENINYMQWGPLGKDYLFAQNGHLFYVAEPGLQPVDISTNSKTTTQIHGLFDWMTEEEIFGTKQAVWWSKDGSKIAFASRDSSDEPAITLTAYRAQEKYQIDTKLVYQKTGEKKLPRYTINIWDKATGSIKSMDVQHRDSSAFHYLFGASWIRRSGKEILAVTWANRWQNETSITLCDYKTEMCKLVFEFSYPAKMWAMPEEYRNLVSTEDSIFLILPHLQLGSGNIYQHVVRVFEESRQILSLGQFDVRSVVRHDAANGLIYFNTMAPRPTSHHLYVTKDVANSSDVFRCVTCSLNCSYAVATFSDSAKRLSIHCRGPTFHRFYQAEVTSKGELQSVQEVLHDTRMEELVQKTVLPTIIDDSIQLEGGIEASTRLYLPHARSHLRALPLLVYVYGGPGWQTIDESFSVGYVDYLVTNLNIAVLKIDARGAGGRGWKYRSPVYGALGHAEMEDQIDVTRLALKKYPYLDPNHMAIHGWSYGGFATLRIVEMAPEKMFKCAISGAPVTNFQYYDAAYTERYMGSRPKESYVDVSQDNLAKFKTTQLLLIHGLTDDNVHYQNSAIFVEALQNNGIDFDLMVYPNERHHLTAGPKWLHGYTRMTKFLRECLLK